MNKPPIRDVTITQLFPSGAYELSTIWDNRLVRKTYYFTNRREALAKFRNSFCREGE